jgi:hypothetical protein
MTIERPMFPPRADPQNLRVVAQAESKTFASSYLDLEPKICDVDRMAQIAFILA